MYLNCKTYFSFKYGTFSTEELVKTAAENGVHGLALTNINNTCNTWDFVDFCKEQHIKPVAGTEIRNESKFMYILLAKNSKGFEVINRFLSEHLQEEKAFPDRFAFNEHVFVVYPFSAVALDTLNANEFAGVQITEVNKLYNINKAYAGSLVIRQPVTFQNKTYYNVHRLLRAIGKNTLITKQDKADLAEAHETFLSPSELFDKFKQYSFVVTNTLRLLDNCSIEPDFSSDKTKKIYTTSKEADKALLEKFAMEGMQQRYGANNKAALERVTKELKIIDEMGFNTYFLDTYDIIRYAQQRKFFYIGRGSGANSIVAYCLQITDVDPLEHDLYFERFLNPYRTSPPDFDLDFSYKDRNEIYDYVFKRWGKEHVCLLGCYSTFQYHATIHELGKAFGLAKEEIANIKGTSLKADEIQKRIHYYGNLIKNFPSHLSIHAGGMLISDEPIYAYTALELPPKGFATSQIDMFIAEKINLFKLDILSQGGLAHIKDAVEIIKKNKNIDVNIHAIEGFKEDKKVAEQIESADTIGCFYIESPAMRQLLKKLGCNNYKTLVAASSVIRPGVAQSGMMKQYIYRFLHPNDFEYLHPKMKELLEETYGVMVYQEDVIKVAHYFGGLNLGEADILRRAMSGKYRGRKQFELIKEKFFVNCKEKGYPPEITEEVWRQIESFGGYSFSKAHSASYAVESYQSLYLKTYYPMELMVAVIRNFRGFYSRGLYFHELRKTGARLHPPCVNKGEYDTSILGVDVFAGFVHVKGLRDAFVQSFLEERNKNGNYQGLQDFIERVNPPAEQLNLLIRIGAFRFTGKSKKELLWEANFLQRKNANHSMNSLLFKDKPVDFKLPVLAKHPLDDTYDEIELFEFSLRNIFELANDDIGKYTPASELKIHVGKEVNILGYLIVSKEVHTSNNRTMYYHTFIDANGDWLDTIFFPQAADRYSVKTKCFYSMRGKVVEEFGVYSVDVHFCEITGIKDRKEEPNKLISMYKNHKQII